MRKRFTLAWVRLAALALAFPAAGQVAIEPATENGRRVIAILDEVFRTPKPKATLSCDIRRLPPALNFALRHHTGYSVFVPLQQFAGGRAEMTILFRVRPMGGEPRYFGQTFRTRTLPARIQSDAVISGGVYVGEGQYDIDWVMLDARERSCAKSWRVENRPRGEERDIEDALKPGEVVPVSIGRWAGTPEKENPLRVAIAVHAAPRFLRATALSRFDISLLTTTLTTLLTKSPFMETGVSVFNLARQREIFRTARLDPPEFDRLLDSLEALELGTVDVRELSDRKAYTRLLLNIAQRESDTSPPPDAVIFLGPFHLLDDKPPESAREILARPGAPRFYYLHLDLRGGMFPDAIERLVRAAGGRTFHITRPKDMAEAIEKIEADLRKGLNAAARSQDEK
jgi:hypothetical protein